MSICPRLACTNRRGWHAELQTQRKSSPKMIEREPSECYGYGDRGTNMAITLQMAASMSYNSSHTQCGCPHFKFPKHIKKYSQKICWCVCVCVCGRWRINLNVKHFRKMRSSMKCLSWYWNLDLFANNAANLKPEYWQIKASETNVAKPV